MCVFVFQSVTSQECKEKLQCVGRPSTEGRGVFYIQTEPAVQGGLAVQQHLTLVPAPLRGKAVLLSWEEKNASLSAHLSRQRQELGAVHMDSDSGT